MTKITRAELIEGLLASGGILGPICAQYKVSRQTIEARIERYPSIRKAKIEGRERLKDRAEYKLAQAVEEGKKWAVEKVIDRLCHDRGYLDKQVLDQTHKFDHEVRSDISDRANKLVTQLGSPGSKGLIASNGVVADS